MDKTDNDISTDEKNEPHSFLGKKTKNPDNSEDKNSSSGSNSFGFQIEQNEKDVVIEFKSIKERNELDKQILSISSPCAIKNKEILNKIQNESKTEQNTIKLSKSFFNELKDDDIQIINKNKMIGEVINKIGKTIFFSSSILKTDNDTDKKIFDKMHYYLTGFSGKSKISDFCFDKNLYFPFSFDDNYLGYDRSLSHGFRIHHFHKTITRFGFGKIIYFFGPTGSGKSICGRATVYNYLHFKKINGKNVFIPAFFFDIKLWYQNSANKKFLLQIIKYELMNICEDFKEWKNFYSEFIKIIDDAWPLPIFTIIEEIIKFFLRKKNDDILLVIDHYSSLYDKNNEFYNLKKICFEQKKLDIFVIFEINMIADQIIFLQYLNDSFTVFHSSNLDTFDTFDNILDLSEKELGIINNYEFRGFSSCLKYNKNIKFEDVPENYKNYFGDNISFYYKYLSLKKNNNELDFTKFVNKEKDDIKLQIINFIESDYSSNNINIIHILQDLMENIKIEQKINFLTFKYLCGAFFTFEKIKELNEYKYKYDYAFPIIKNIFEELIDIFDEKYFLDIKSPEFLKLDGVTMGIIFDKYMNNWFKNQLNFGFMEFSRDDIESYDLDYLIKKNSKNFHLTKNFTKTDVESEIRTSEQLILIKEKLKGIKKHKKCIILFQKFNGKSIDICFLIKRIDGVNFYSINSLQIKCSDNFIIDEELQLNNKFEMTYLKNKLEILFNITIKESYVTYLSILEIPKKCALDNPEKFFYFSRVNGKFFGSSKEIIDKFPFYNKCKIEFIDFERFINIAHQLIEFASPRLKFNLDIVSENSIIVGKKQINNSVIIKIREKKFEININLENITSKLVGDNESEIKNKDYYFIIRHKNQLIL